MPTILVLAKNPWNNDQMASLSESVESVKSNSENGKWLNATVQMRSSDLLESGSSLQVRIVCPASDADVFKYTTQKRLTYSETPQFYQSVVEAWINRCIANNKPDHTWIDRILDGSKEADRVICSDPDPLTGFVYVKNFNWDETSLGDLACLLIVRDKSLRTIRDLRAKHIPLLQKLLDTIYQKTSEVYGHDDSDLRVFFHYYPTFFQLHIHAMAITRAEFIAAKCLSVKDVISNLEIDGDYYSKVSIVCETATDSHLGQAWTQQK